MSEMFHLRLRRLREAKGWDVAKLAKKSDVSKKHIQALEADRGEIPTWYAITKLAVTLDTNPFYLSTGDGDFRPHRVQRRRFEETNLSQRS